MENDTDDYVYQPDDDYYLSDDDQYRPESEDIVASVLLLLGISQSSLSLVGLSCPSIVSAGTENMSHPFSCPSLSLTLCS